MKNALVTGASSGIGQAISSMLIENGYNVIGIGRRFDDNLILYSKQNFTKIVLDLRDIDKLNLTVKNINKESPIDLVVNAAGAAYYGLHEVLNSEQINEIVNVNLTAPMIITNLLIKTIKERSGMIINISSVTANNVNPHGAAYGATKAGLSSFSKSLYEEYRKWGVKLVDIKPDMTKTNLYRNADFTVDDDKMAYLEPDDIALAIKDLLSLRDGLCVNEISLTPRYKRIKKTKNQSNGGL
ncbi:MAG: SDR family NAD(P)-dependent oxidoreductase [Lachnospiraceae bacterium]|nr:SDR family NAD(P)-dependent oxidoreductase [Lachnospiraceae bacterium]